MEKLNKYAPYILVICGALVAILSFVVQHNTIKGFLGLGFMALGIFNLYMKNKTN